MTDTIYTAGSNFSKQVNSENHIFQRALPSLHFYSIQGERSSWAVASSTPAKIAEAYCLTHVSLPLAIASQAPLLVKLISVVEPSYEGSQGER